MSIALVEKLCKYYGESQNAVRALDGVSLSVEQNEFAAVVGTSGKRKVNSHYERYKAVHFAGRECSLRAVSIGVEAGMFEFEKSSVFRVMI